MKSKPKIILDIVPLTWIPLTRNQSFSYLFSEKLSAGTLVSIPLFKRKISGIVLGAKPAFPRLGNIELKKIDSIIEKTFLDERQIELARFISDYYLCPLGIVLKFFVPKRVKSRDQRSINKEQRTIIKGVITLTKEQQEAIGEIAKNQKLQTKNFYLFGPAGSGKTEVYIHSIAKLKSQNANLQFLILLPEIMLTPQAVERYGAYFKPEKIAVLNSKISKGQFYENWKKIKSGEAKIIIGSRMAVFAPFKNLGLIVIDEEQDISYKQWDMNPRYDARTVAIKLAEIHSAKVVFGSATPSIEAYYKAEKKEYKLLELPHLNLQTTTYNLQPNSILVDMRKERWKVTGQSANYSPISRKLQSEISYALKNKLQTILFINRQGMSNFSICADCRTVLKCSKCDRALIYDSAGFYRCAHCSYKTSITPQCSKCKGLRFTNIGLGTQKVEREIRGLFPQARIARADNQSMSAAGSQEKLYREFSAGLIDILIGTQMISKSWDLPTVALVGIIDADNLFSTPDFNTNLRAYQNIVQVSGRVGRPGAKFPGTIVIQTYNPENALLKFAAEKNFKAFYQKEISERKTLLLPPFGKIVKLVCQGYGREKVEAEAGRVYGILAKKRIKNTQISEPHDGYVEKIRGRFRKQIIIKLRNKQAEFPTAVQSLLKSLPVEWMIDINPISIV